MSRQRSMSVAFVAAVIAVAIGIVLSYTIHWFPVAASTQAKNTDELYHVLVIASIPIFVLVVTVILYCVWQFRMKPGEELKDGPPIHGNTRLEVFWTTLPAVLLLGLVGLLVRGPARKRKEAGSGDQDRRDRPAVLLVLPVPAVADRGPADQQLPAVSAERRVGRVRHALEGRHPRVLDPGVPPAGGRRARHHDPLPRDAGPAGQLSGRVQPAVRGGAFADALDGPRRDPGPVPGVDRQPAARGLEQQLAAPPPPAQRPAGLPDNVADNG